VEPRPLPVSSNAGKLAGAARQLKGAVLGRATVWRKDVVSICIGPRACAACGGLAGAGDFIGTDAACAEEVEHGAAGIVASDANEVIGVKRRSALLDVGG